MEATGSYNPQKFIEAVRGAFGPKTEKVSDVLEELVHKISSLVYENAACREKITSQARDVTALTAEKESMVQRQYELSQSFQHMISSKDEEIVKAKELAKKYAKYEPMAKVKSIEEIGIVLPEEAIKAADEMVKNYKEALDSMLEYLLTGKGQEKALEQLNRHSIIGKARKDRITDIDEVAQKLEEVEDDIGKVGFTAANYARTMIRWALTWSEKGSLLKSPAVKKQIETNAMGILTPLCEGKFCHDTPEYI